MEWNLVGSIPSDKFALLFNKVEHLYRVNRIAPAIPIDPMML